MSYHVPPPAQIVPADPADLGRFRRSSKRSIDPENIVDTFSACCPPTPNDEDCRLCCVGCVAPCCLVGSFVAVRRSGFAKTVDPCDGCEGRRRKRTCTGMVYNILLFFKGKNLLFL